MSALRFFHTGIFTPLDIIMIFWAGALTNSDHRAAAVVVGIIWAMMVFFLPCPFPAGKEKRS